MTSDPRRPEDPAQGDASEAQKFPVSEVVLASSLPSLPSVALPQPQAARPGPPSPNTAASTAPWRSRLGEDQGSARNKTNLWANSPPHPPQASPLPRLRCPHGRSPAMGEQRGEF